MKINSKLSVFVILFSVLLLGCEKEEIEQLAGTPGNPRFNLEFTNAEQVDLDLYVETPNGTYIYYANTSGQGGVLDVDCKCSSCPNGPSENIYWEPGSAPSGTYKYWVQYFNSCGNSSSTSDFTLRVVNNTTVLETYRGTLSADNRKSQIYSKVY